MTKRTVYRAGLCLLVAVMVGVNLAGVVRDGVVRASFAQQSCAAVVTGVAPGAAAHGLRRNDVVDFRRLAPEQRLGFVNPFSGSEEGIAGARTALPISRGDANVVVMAPFERALQPPLLLALDALGLLVYVVTGALVLWRGRDVAAQALGSFLLCFAAGGFGFDRTAFLPALPRVALNVVAFGLTALAIYSAFVLNERLSRDILDARVLRVIRVVAAAYCGLYAVIVVASQITLPAFGCTLPLYNAYVLLFFGGALGVMAILGAAAVKSHFRERRIAWLFWTTVVCLIPFIAVKTADTLLGIDSMRSVWVRVAVESLPFALLPIGYAYAILRYHVVDVSFVLNRALVFAMLSSALLGSVIVVEALAARAALGKNESLALELAVAVALGLSFNSVHKWLERIIDRALFRDKHRAEEVLSRLASDSAFIEKAATLRERTVNLVCAQARAAGAAFYERTETGYRLVLGAGRHAFPGDIDADDAAFVRMRANAVPLALSDVQSAIGRDGIVFPLAAGGRIFGALVCGARENGERYDPDERELLGRVAHDVAAALTAAHSRERAEFVAAVADERVDLAEARLRARELRGVE